MSTLIINILAFILVAFAIMSAAAVVVQLMRAVHEFRDGYAEAGDVVAHRSVA